MNEDHILICFKCSEIRDMPSAILVERIGHSILECCDQDMYKFERNKLYVLVKNIDKIKDQIEKEIVESFNA